MLIHILHMRIVQITIMALKHQYRVSSAPFLGNPVMNKQSIRPDQWERLMLGFLQCMNDKKGIQPVKNLCKLSPKVHFITSGGRKLSIAGQHRFTYKWLLKQS